MIERITARHRTAFSVVVHLFLFALAYFAACGALDNFWRFDKWLRPYFLNLFWLPILIKLAVFGWMGLYRGFWRYVGIRDAVSVFKASTWSTCLFIMAYQVDRWVLLATSNTLFGEAGKFPESIFVLDWAATMAIVVGARAAARVYYEESRLETEGESKRCLILGAGDTGESLAREILRMPFARYTLVGFLDDDPHKAAVRIHDIPVLGTIDQARPLADQYEIDELLLAMPRAPQKKLRAIVETCQGTHLRFRTVPALADLIGGKVRVSQVRDVDINDLLGRDPVQLDNAAIAAFIQDKRVIITGAGGSIGSEICRQVVRYNPSRVVLIEQAENNLFMIDRELAELAPKTDRVCYIADICDEERIRGIFATERPHAVFHAAAHKHVPLMESNISEAVKNNVRGTLVLAEAATRIAAERFVMISTDKAVNPTSVMGCTKRVAELGLQQVARRSRTQFITVRFGNVLGSSGSVVPIFRQQIARGGPVTVTHPDMTRYFMTIPEATQLVLQAGAMGTGGEIFVLDMGEPVKIVDLARQMITLSGFRPGEDIEISFSGIRPGEKLYEELSVSGENMSPTRHQKIYVWRQRAEEWDRVSSEIDALVAAADAEACEQIKQRLKRLVPEYRLEEGTGGNHRPAAGAASSGAASAESSGGPATPSASAAVPHSLAGAALTPAPAK